MSIFSVIKKTATSQTKTPSDSKSPPLKSKKFIFATLMSVLWKVIMLVIIFEGVGATVSLPVLTLIILIDGMSQIGYLHGQAGIDKVVRLAQINASVGIATPLKKAQALMPGHPRPPTQDEVVFDDVEIDIVEP